jgi:ArsR family transcriptional regulator, arsenate/arsenite/antimonite-responsive transcriptional repressor
MSAIKPSASSKTSAVPQQATLEDVLASFRTCAPIFQALGDTFRQDIVMLLAQHERLNVNQITEHIALSRPAVSHHLKALLQAGLLQMERVSRENFYSLSIDDALLQLRQLVEQAEVSCT